MPVPGTPILPESTTNAAPPAANGAYAIHLHAMSTKAGEYGIGFSLNGSDTCKTTIDLSRFVAVRFSYLADWLPPNEKALRFQVPLAATTSIEYGGTCPTSQTCDSNHYSVELPATATWKDVTVLLDPNSVSTSGLKLVQETNVNATPFDPKAILTFQFNVRSTSDAVRFSVWVDNFVLLTSL